MGLMANLCEVVDARYATCAPIKNIRGRLQGIPINCEAAELTVKVSGESILGETSTRSHRSNCGAGALRETIHYAAKGVIHEQTGEHRLHEVGSNCHPPHYQLQIIVVVKGNLLLQSKVQESDKVKRRSVLLDIDPTANIVLAERIAVFRDHDRVESSASPAYKFLQVEIRSEDNILGSGEALPNPARGISREFFIEGQAEEHSPIGRLLEERGSLDYWFARFRLRMNGRNRSFGRWCGLR